MLQAASGRRALQLLRERQPDAMLLDLVMPAVDGFQVLHEKNRDPRIRDVPVIVVSSRDPSGDPIVSDALTVVRSGGLSLRDLVVCTQELTQLLVYGEPLDHQVQPGSPDV